MRTPLDFITMPWRRAGLRQGPWGSLKARLRWSYAMVSVVPLVLLGIIVVWFVLRAHRKDVIKEQQTAANWVAREIRVSLAAIDEQLLKLGPRVRPGQSPQAVGKAVGELMTSMPEITGVAVVDTTGVERIHVTQVRGFYDSEMIDRSDDELLMWTLEQARVAQGSMIYQPDGLLVYPSYAPILSDTGQVLGAIRVEVRIDRIARTLREAPLSRGSIAYLVDSKGILQYAGDRAAPQSAPAGLASRLGGPIPEQEYLSGNGKIVLGAWSPIPVQPASWWVVVELPRAVAYEPVRQASLLLIAAVALVVVTSMGWGLYQSRSILQPIQELRTGAVMIGAGDLAARIPIHGGDEIGELAGEFNRMAERLQRSHDEIERQNERLREGLALARDIQLGLLPSAPPGNMPHLAVRAHSLPAYEVGGDFYTYIALDKERMAVAVGDISGKGVAAALMMALASSMVEAHGRTVTRPELLLTDLNKQLSARLAVNRMNAALLYAIVDMERRNLCVANAGMISPLLLRDGNVELVEAYGLPLGSMPEARYVAVEVDLQPGDLLVLVSDGIVEARRAGGELFGFDRIEQILSRHAADRSPDDLITTIMQEVALFVDDAEQHDDMTIVVIQPNLSPVLDTDERPVDQEVLV
ncbi:MAG TPA: SpoIIE family protein phosphatase [Herpetosiphonaceae bacterium]|nr:SpoIIE family protein phosphatase [Herpetosiphonaceae bacterium]